MIHENTKKAEFTAFEKNTRSMFTSWTQASNKNYLFT